MAKKATLRAVSADEVAPPSKPLTVVEAAASGDHKKLLTAMRERIAKTVADPDCPPRDLAALTRRLQDIAKELASIELREKQEAEEEIVGGGDADETWDASAI